MGKTKWTVCPQCEGNGTVDNLGAITGDQLDEWFGDGDERYQFMDDYRSGVYDTVCPTCNGNRVVDGSPEAVAYREEIARMEAEMRAEQRIGGTW